MALIRETESRYILFLDRSQAHRALRSGIDQKVRKVCRRPSIFFCILYQNDMEASYFQKISHVVFVFRQVYWHSVVS
jgi:hypothetical protein